jgi:hypothetical protein
MLRKELIIGVFVAFTLLVSFGNALAEDSNDKSILGTDEFTFDAPETKADVAVRNHVYDEKQLAMIGTEAGSEIASTPKALHAARNNNYDEEQLAAVGTEAGNWEFRFDGQGSGTNEAIADKRDATCSKC